MFVTHKDSKEDQENGVPAVPAGVLFPARDEFVDALIAAGVADERIVRCTEKHYINETQTVVYGERQVIERTDHALRALAIGKAVLEPPLGGGVNIEGAVVDEKFTPLAKFRPETAPKPKKQGGKSQRQSETAAADPANNDQSSDKTDTP